jgi:tRNA-dihydrouridine synthase
MLIDMLTLIQMTANNLVTRSPFLVLAPMDEVTDTVFRQIVSACAAPDIAFTEFVNVDGLCSPGRSKLLKKARFVASEKNLILQLWGLQPENFLTIARQAADGTLAAELGVKGTNYIGVDLNMGCPAKGEVQNGACSALIKNRPLAHDIITATKQGLAGRLPLSVKTRLGFNEVDMTWLQFLLEHQLDMLTVHGRTRKEMSKVPAHWDLIGEARMLRDTISPTTKIVGNGDVKSYQHAVELATTYGLDGIMIGRGVFQDPFLFAPKSPWPDYAAAERLALYKRQVRLFADTWQHAERPIHTLNKFCKVYVSGFDGAKELRESLMQTASLTELIDCLDSIQLPVISRV